MPPVGDHRYKQAYLSIVDHTFEFIGLLAPDGTLLEANRSALEFAGIDREEVVGRPFWDTPWWRGYPELQERLRNAIAEAAQGRFSRFEALHRAPDGRVATIDFSVRPVTDESGRVVLIVPEGRDITERKRAENRQQFLAEAGGLLATIGAEHDLLSKIAKLAVRFVADCCIVDVVEDEGVRRLEVAHAAADRPWFADVLARIPLDQTRPHLVWSVLETRKPVLMSDVPPGFMESVAQSEEHLRALLALELRSLMAVPLLVLGRILGVLLFISSRADRRYEAEDLRVAMELAQRVALAVENARLYRTAQDAIEGREEVLRVVAHDLRTPLSTALMAATAILRVCRAENDAGKAAHKLAATISRSLDRASRLIRDLLDVARMERGGFAVERTALPPGEILMEVAEMFASPASDRSLELETKVPEELPPVFVDRERILQVLSNLVDNAVKFTPPGGRVRIEAERRNDEVCFSVSDTGPGILHEHLPRVFDRFWQARQADRRGTGLGLPIARRLVEAHGGRIWAESTPGQGSTFHFTVPIAPVPVAPAAASPSASERPSEPDPAPA